MPWSHISWLRLSRFEQLHDTMWPTILLPAAVLLSSVCSVQATSQVTCLTDANAKLVANNFATLFSNYTEAFANKTVAVDYTDQTDSVSWLISNGRSLIFRRQAMSKHLLTLSLSQAPTVPSR